MKTLKFPNRNLVMKAISLDTQLSAVKENE